MNKEFITIMGKDLFNFITGKNLGEGIGRTVYECNLIKDTVIKIERSGFQNIREWEIWDEVKETKYAKWFAPCIYISPCGIYLIQKKTEKIPKSEYPEKVPAFLFDKKYDNYGIIKKGNKKQLVAHDYGTFSLTNGYSNRLVKANWWE